jgi:hypothetical protein
VRPAATFAGSLLNEYRFWPSGNLIVSIARWSFAAFGPSCTSMFTMTFAPIHSHCGLRRWNSCLRPHFSSISVLRFVRHGAFCSSVHW